MLFYLRSEATETEDYFYHSILCIAEQNEKGALGFIINRPFPRSLNELQEFYFLPSFPLYEGGPVDTGHLYFLHRRPDIIEDGKQVAAGIYLGGNFSQAVTCIERGILNQDDIRIFVGYCGWDANELEEEIKAGDWTLADAILFP